MALTRRAWLRGACVAGAVLLGRARPSAAGAIPLYQVNRSSPLNRALRAWWLVVPTSNVGGTVWRDIAGRGYHGTLNAMARPATSTSGFSRTTQRRSGVGELRFDGTDDYVSASAVPTQQQTQFSVGFWFRMDAIGADGVMVGKGGANEYAWVVVAGADGSLYSTHFTCGGGGYTDAGKSGN